MPPALTRVSGFPNNIWLIAQFCKVCSRKFVAASSKSLILLLKMCYNYLIAYLRIV